jgi:hypothetical protein
MLVLITNTKHYPNLFRSCGDKTCRKDGHHYPYKMYVLFLHIVQRKHNYCAENKTYYNARTDVCHILSPAYYEEMFPYDMVNFRQLCWRL